MKNVTKILLAVFFISLVSVSGFCADSGKIATFDIQKVLGESSSGKMTQKQLREKFKESQDKLNAEKEQLEQMKKDLEREAMVLSAEKSDEKQRNFKIRVMDFKKMQEDLSNDFKRLENDLKNKILQDIYEITNVIGKEDGYLLILEMKASGIFFHQDSLDITDKIIEKYNLKVAQDNKDKK